MREPFSPLPYFGSFQHGDRYAAEDPRSEVWRRIARLGTVDSARDLCVQRKLPKDRATLVSARLRQGVELRTAARGATLLTAPLLQFYSMQNLARGIIGLSEKCEPKAQHGIDFHPKGRNILDAEAEFGTGGTFGAFAKVLGGTIVDGARMTLRDAMSCIPELRSSLSGELGPTRVARLNCTIMLRGGSGSTIRVSLPDLKAEALKTGFAKMFPTLADVATPSEKDHVLDVTTALGDDYKSIADNLAGRLLSDLRFREDAVWYALREDQDVPKLPRAVYYFVCLFILSSIVRYEPRLVADLNPDATRLGWALRDLLDTSDRYFPQLLLSMGRRHPTLFN